MSMSIFKNVRLLVFLPPALLLVAAVLASFINFDGYLKMMTAVNAWFLGSFGWLIILASFAAVILMAVVPMSPLGKIRIGGADAKPYFGRWTWFAITVCSTIATGILFWGVAEPLFHLNTPPNFSDEEARTSGAAQFSLSTIYLHWTITPYAVYAVPSLAFALAFHNLGKPYSLGGPLSMVAGKALNGVGASVVDALALLALIAGVASSLGAGVLTISSGMEYFFGVPDNAFTRLIVASVIVAAFVVSSISGLQRGIKILSSLNLRIFFALAAFVFIAGPTLMILKLGLGSSVEYIATFFQRSIDTVGVGDTKWKNDWTIFQFSSWLAWAPITAMFLGRIAYGYTVREFVLFSLILPALFGLVWMTIFGGAALEIDLQNKGALTDVLNDKGPEAVIYQMLQYFPLTLPVITIFLFTTFISFVTAMDSNTHSIASICAKSETPEQNDIYMKVFWGVFIGLVSWIMTATIGVDGVRILAQLGGVIGLFILIGCSAVLVRFIINTKLFES